MRVVKSGKVGNSCGETNSCQGTFVLKGYEADELKKQEMYNMKDQDVPSEIFLLLQLEHYIGKLGSPG